MNRSMKNLIIVLALASLSLGLAAEGLDVSIEADLQSLNVAPMMYYRYQSAPSQEAVTQEARALGEKFNAYTSTSIKMEESVEGVPLFFKEDSKASFTVFSPQSLGFIFTKDMNTLCAGEGNTVGLPSEYAAPDVAMKHLESLDLLPANQKEMTLAHVGGIGIAVYDQSTGQVTGDYDKVKTVIYGRTLNGLRVMGASRLVVNLGENGELVGIIKNWPEISKQVLYSPKELVAQGKWDATVESFLGNRYAQTNINKIQVKESELVMFDDGEGVIEPALFLKGKTFSEEGKEFEGDWIVPVLQMPKANYRMVSPELPARNADSRSLSAGTPSLEAPDADDAF